MSILLSLCIKCKNSLLTYRADRIGFAVYGGHIPGEQRSGQWAHPQKAIDRRHTHHKSSRSTAIGQRREHVRIRRGGGHLSLTGYPFHGADGRIGQDNGQLRDAMNGMHDG
jgi:hypothetical protein